jgi:hypothetical protein
MKAQAKAKEQPKAGAAAASTSAPAEGAQKAALHHVLVEHGIAFDPKAKIVDLASVFGKALSEALGADVAARMSQQLSDVLQQISVLSDFHQREVGELRALCVKLSTEVSELKGELSALGPKVAAAVRTGSQAAAKADASKAEADRRERSSHLIVRCFNQDATADYVGQKVASVADLGPGELQHVQMLRSSNRGGEASSSSPARAPFITFRLTFLSSASAVKALQSKARHGVKGEATGIVLQEDLSPGELRRKHELLPLVKQLRAGGAITDFRRDQLVVLEPAAVGAVRGRWVPYKPPNAEVAAPVAAAVSPPAVAPPAAPAHSRVTRATAES